MICTKCNSDIPENSNFCPFCNAAFKKSNKGLMITSFILYGLAFIAVIFFILVKFTDIFSSDEKLYDPTRYIPKEYSAYAETGNSTTNNNPNIYY